MLFFLFSAALTDQQVSIDKDSGVLTVKDIDIDSIENTIFLLQIKAYEEENPSSFVTQDVTLIVNDVNDNKPTITLDPTSLNIDEGASSIDGINTFNVLDPDSVSYFLVIFTY